MLCFAQAWLNNVTAIRTKRSMIGLCKAMNTFRPMVSDAHMIVFIQFMRTCARIKADVQYADILYGLKYAVCFVRGLVGGRVARESKGQGGREPRIILTN